MQGGRFRPPLGVCGIAGFAGRCKHRPLRTRGKALPGSAGYLWGKAAMHPSVCALRRIHRPVCGARIARRALKHACALRPLHLLRLAFSAAGGARLRSPLQGRLWGDRHPEGSPVRGAVGVSRLRGAAPCLANTLPGRRKAPGGRERPPYNARETGGRTGGRPPHAPVRSQRLRRGRCLHRPADGPGGGLPLPRYLPFPAAMQGGRFRPPLGVCGIAGFAGRCEHRPLRMRGKALPGSAGYLWGKAAMHPSVCALRRIHFPLQGRLWGIAAL